MISESDDVWSLKASSEIPPTNGTRRFFRVGYINTFTPSRPFRFPISHSLLQSHFRFSLSLSVSLSLSLSLFLDIHIPILPLSQCTCSASTILSWILADSIPTLLWFSSFFTVPTSICYNLSWVFANFFFLLTLCVLLRILLLFFCVWFIILAPSLVFSLRVVFKYWERKRVDDFFFILNFSVM